MKFNAGDYVSYASKKLRVDFDGIIIAANSSNYWIEPTHIRKRGQSWYWYKPTIRRNRRGSRLMDRFEDHDEHYLRSKEHVFILGTNARNITSGIKDYNPEQNGDTDEDI